jgi:glucosylglycerate synthase
MSATPSALATSPAAPGREEILVALEAGDRGSAVASAATIRTRLAAGFPGRTATVLLATAGPLVDPAEWEGAPRVTAASALAGGGIPGHPSALGALLHEADRRGARAAALVAAGAHDETGDWLALLLDPILDAGFDYVCPAYRREKLDGMLGTAIVHPLTRALYGRRLRPSARGEAALSLGLARALLDDPDWRRDPAYAGSQAWLVASVLTGPFRSCQAWLGRWPQSAGETEAASQALARVVGPVFHEMERHADRWQRVEGSEPVRSFGQAGTFEDGPVRVDPQALADAFRLGLRELGDLWDLVLPPATRLALRRAAAAPAQAFRLGDALWARIVYDFAVAYSIRTVERQQLLRSMTPLYLGWVAGLVSDIRILDGPGTDGRVEALCEAFEREKPYAIARWRWPDGFDP